MPRPSARPSPKKDRPTVDENGQRLERTIAGLVVRRLVPIEDMRGQITEVYRGSWGFSPDPLVYIYQVTLRVGSVRGWVVHKKQEDRIFTSQGVMTWAFYDARASSPTHGLLNVLTFSEQNRAIFVIPRGVYHAVKNIGEREAMFLNTPTRPYDHRDPDKYRLPLKNRLIPFDFSTDGPR